MVAALDVELEPHRFGEADALEAVHLRPNHEYVLERRLGPHLARHLRILDPGVVPHPRKQAARDIRAENLDHVAAKRSQRLGMNEQHALIVEPDATVACREMQTCHQVGKVREAHLVDVCIDLLHDRQVADRKGRRASDCGLHSFLPVIAIAVDTRLR